MSIIFIDCATLIMRPALARVAPWELSMLTDGYCFVVVVVETLLWLAFISNFSTNLGLIRKLLPGKGRLVYTTSKKKGRMSY